MTLAEIMKGAPAASALDAKTSALAAELRAKGVCPTLAIVRVGARGDDVAYEGAAARHCARVGVGVRLVSLPDGTGQAELMEHIAALNADEGVHGVLLLRPLPRYLDEGAVCAAIAPEKDVDGVTPGSMALAYSGAGEGFAPCTAEAVMTLLRHYGVELCGKRAAVVGRSLVIGRPAAMLLMAANATVTVCHRATRGLSDVLRESDIIVAAAGSPESLGAACFRAGQAVADVGTTWSPERGRLVGDVCFDEAARVVEALSPVPGGVGAVTTAVLAAHTVSAAERRTR